MAEVKAFRGLRFNLQTPQDLGMYTAPPYDMINDSMVNELYDLHPHNAVRIIQNKKEDSDKENRDRHIRAASILKSWMDEGVIKKDEKDSVYIYAQKFSADINGVKGSFERIGVITLVKLVDFEEKVVFPHEYTLSGPKQDRYELLDASRTNTGQIFGLIPDEGDLFTTIKKMKEGRAPLGEFTDENEVVHSLYSCEDEQLIGELKKNVDSRSVLIADGHHRYETALRYYKEKGSDAYSHLMMTLVSMADPGLVIRPFHRMVNRAHAGEQVVMGQALKKYFDMKVIGKADTQEVTRALAQEVKDKEIVYWDCDSSELYLLKLNEEGEEFLKSVMPEHSDLWKHLEVSVINTIVINKILSLPLDGHVLHDVVEYVNDVSDAAQALGSADKYYGGFFIKPLSIQAINDIVKGGERMPQKSTNFFPKLFSGLVFNKME
ncbi:hypothetical protein CHISP_1796 [Chitinispirillum alkaliphilum]|nr:hypothetical protein CHISP_1796 [Chitinispirillum alkaliphilum]